MNALVYNGARDVSISEGRTSPGTTTTKVILEPAA